MLFNKFIKNDEKIREIKRFKKASSLIKQYFNSQNAREGIVLEKARQHSKGEGEDCFANKRILEVKKEEA